MALLPTPHAGTPELAQHGGADNGLTGFSLDLDEFERPPELQPGEPAQQEQQLAQQEQQEEAMQLADAVEAAAAEEQHAWQTAEAEAQAMQLDGFASPALQPAGGEFGTGALLVGGAAAAAACEVLHCGIHTLHVPACCIVPASASARKQSGMWFTFPSGYPLDDVVPGSGGAIPGGPKLHRTPVPVRSASQPRSVQGTPHSNAHSLRSQPRSAAMAAALQHATPATHGTHGTHRLARTPGSVRPAAVAYPIDADVTADSQVGFEVACCEPHSSVRYATSCAWLWGTMHPPHMHPPAHCLFVADPRRAQAGPHTNGPHPRHRRLPARP